MNRVAFFDRIRGELFGGSLSTQQVEGIDALLDAGEHLSIDHMAHVLAECYHETGGGMYPVKETVFPHSRSQNPSDAEVIRRLDGAWKAGRLPWVKQPYWRDGWFGRGMIQLTHKRNYRQMFKVVGVDLVADPDLALEVDTSAKIAVLGCERGAFTGKKLRDFDRPDGFDHHSARSIVNGDKQANGRKIAACAGSFTKALRKGGWCEASSNGLLTMIISIFRKVTK